MLYSYNGGSNFPLDKFLYRSNLNAHEKENTLGIIENAENKGRAKGRETRNEEIAKKLYDMKMPVDYISKATDLSEDEIMYCVASPRTEYQKVPSKFSVIDNE